MENNFKRCAKDDLEFINKFKSEIPESHSGKLLVKTLIEKDQYEWLDQVLNWCYLGNQQRIAEFKCNMYINNFWCCVINILRSLIEKDNTFKSLDKFIC